jgi:hypothetical protein
MMQKNLQKVISSKHSMRVRQPTGPAPNTMPSPQKEHHGKDKGDDSQCVIS